MIELTDQGKALLSKLLAIPPDLGQLKQELEAGKYTADDVSRAAYYSVDKCCWEECPDDDSTWVKKPEQEYIPGQHSAFVYDIVRLLLDHGLDPNAIYDDDNIMLTTQYIYNEYVGADTLGLLLEAGGDIDLIVDGEGIFDQIDFDVIFDAHEQRDRQKYDALIHCWFVLLGYGAWPKNGSTPVDILARTGIYEDLDLKEFELSDLKDHRNFTYGLTYVPSRGENWSLHIFDKRTGWEVARL